MDAIKEVKDDNIMCKGCGRFGQEYKVWSMSSPNAGKGFEKIDNKPCAFCGGRNFDKGSR